MQKLVLAQDTSNVDDTDMSSGEVRERDKKRRHLNAKRKLSSSSEDEESMAIANKENCETQNKKFPPFPQIEKFISNSTLILKKKSTQPIKNIMSDDIFTSTVSNDVILTSIITIL